MRWGVRDWIAICAASLDLREPIYEFGSREPDDQFPEFGNLRPFFPDKRYIGVDMQPGKGVDRVDDLCNLRMLANSVRTALVMETLEHIRYPFEAMANLYRVLTPTGILIMSVPFLFPIHGYPEDYFRYTPQGVEVLLEKFPRKIIIPEGKPDSPHTIFAVASKDMDLSFEELKSNYALLIKERLNTLREHGLPESELEYIVNGMNYQLAKQHVPVLKE